MGELLLAWCTPSTSAVAAYCVYKDDVDLDTVGASITELPLTYSVTAIFQFSPLIKSDKRYCPAKPHRFAAHAGVRELCPRRQHVLPA